MPLFDRGTLIAPNMGMTPIYPDETQVHNIMVREVVCVARDMPIAKLEELLVELGISGVPVTDTDGRPVGMVSKTDLVAAHSRHKVTDETRVADIMMPMTFCVGVDETVAKTAGLMAFEGLHRVPVVNREGRVIGLVAALDVLRWLARESGYAIANRH
jgi:predicted transcriptional regulator